MISQLNGYPIFVFLFIPFLFSIVTCRLCDIRVVNDNDVNVYVYDYMA